MIILLESPLSDQADLDLFVRMALQDGCVLICSYGPDSGAVHDEIDDNLVFDFAMLCPRPEAYLEIVTTWHADLKEAMEFAQEWEDGGHEIRLERL